MATAYKQNAFPKLTLLEIDKRMGLRSGFHEITPIIAQQILRTRNTHNRPVSEIKVAQIKADIQTGRYGVNGESVIFDRNGNLADGQHRLTAVSEVGLSIVSNVAFGVEPEAQNTVDQGKARTAGDVLGIEGVKNSKNLAAVIRSLISYERGDRRSLGRPSEVSTQEIREYLDANPDVERLMDWAMYHKRAMQGLGPPSTFGIARGIIEPLYGSNGVFYLDRVILGDMLTSGDPALTVRNRLMAEKRANRQLALEAILRGCLAHVEGRRLTRVQLDGTFPKL